MVGGNLEINLIWLRRDGSVEFIIKKFQTKRLYSCYTYKSDSDFIQ